MNRRLWAAMLSALVLSWLLLPPAHAAGEAPTTITFQVPSEGKVGEPVALQARLTDEKGAPIPDATIVFLSAATFLNVAGDVELAQATTDVTGQARADYVLRRSGDIEMLAEFHGTDRYAPSTAMGRISVSGTTTLYRPHVGIQVPWLHVSILMATLAVVWSLYVVAAFQLLRLAASGSTRSAGRQP